MEKKKKQEEEEGPEIDETLHEFGQEEPKKAAKKKAKKTRYHSVAWFNVEVEELSNSDVKAEYQTSSNSSNAFDTIHNQEFQGRNVFQTTVFFPRILFACFIVLLSLNLLLITLTHMPTKQQTINSRR